MIISLVTLISISSLTVRGQAEISQGVLQAIYEYQTMVSKLLGMDFANASSYDVGSATADALVVARDNFRGKRNRVLVSLPPEIISCHNKRIGSGKR